MQINEQKKDKKLKSRDFITLGIFSVLFIIVCFLCIFASSIAVVTQPFGIAIAALLGGTIYMYMRAKVNKFGGVLITGVLLALAMLASGSGWIIVVSLLAATAVAELLTQAGRNENFWLTTAGYAVLMTAFAASSYAPMILMKESYYQLAMSNSVDNAYMLELLDFYTGPILIAALAATAVCSVLGALLAKVMVKKHFSRVGMV
ncbi:MAG: MptD family putative ECF transporter S component [Oscillospiraceae bacterium]